MNDFKLHSQNCRTNKVPIMGKITIIASYIVLLFSYPYVFNRLITVPSEQIISIVILFVMIFVNLSVKVKKQLPKTISYIFLIQSFFWFTFFCYHSDSSYLVRIFYLILTFLITSTLVKTESLKEFVKINNILITVQSLLAALGFILVFAGILYSLGDYTNIDSRPFHWYGITCSNVRLGNFIRVSGFFDEPGALAYWGIYALVFNKLFFDNKIIERCLIISLFFTLSAAYIVQIFVYLLCFNANKRGVVFITILGLAIVFLLNNVQDNEILRYMTVDRFDENGIRSSRTELSEMAKGYFVKNPLMGMGAQNMEDTIYMGDNPYEIPAKDGIIGTIVTYLPILYILIKYGRSKKVFCSIFVLALGYLQRPFHVNEIHFLMMYLLVTMIILKYKQNGRKSKSINSDCVLQLS